MGNLKIATRQLGQLLFLPHHISRHCRWNLWQQSNLNTISPRAMLSRQTVHKFEERWFDSIGSSITQEALNSLRFCSSSCRITRTPWTCLEARIFFSSSNSTESWLICCWNTALKNPKFTVSILNKMKVLRDFL